jgi:hypothetical protein
VSAELVAHVRLCHSRMLFVRAYPRETQEMVFDAHDRAFALFKGTAYEDHEGALYTKQFRAAIAQTGQGNLYDQRIYKIIQ